MSRFYGSLLLTFVAWNLAYVAPAQDTVAPPSAQNEDDNIAEKLPRIPPKEPGEALDSFAILSGFHLEQVAAEPLVRDPVAMAFDENGRLFVIEMCDYSEQDRDFLGSVRLLEDTNGDGRFDKSTLFADRLSWPTAIACYDGGIFVGAAPDIFYLKDTDGDGRADEHKVVFTGFSRSNVQGMLNSFQWGPDCRIYGSASSGGGKITSPLHPERPAVNCRGRDFSFNPRTMEFRTESGGAQHGLTFDDWGRRFVCSNGDHLQMIMYDDRQVGRNPLAAMPPARLSIAADGPQAEVFRISPVETWRIIRTEWRKSGKSRGALESGGRASGYFTSATGITIYRGDAFPPEFRGLAFVADVGSNLVHRKVLEPAGVPLAGKRLDEGHEFIASKDNWFRPVQFGNAPDGTLYILDMYREVIEHPKAIPTEIKSHLDLTSGRDRGRIYRVAPDGYQQRPKPNLGSASTAELVALLEHRNGWHRDVASRLLFQRQDPTATSLIAKVAQTSKFPDSRIQAMYLLEALEELPDAIVLHGLKDSHPRVREQAVKLADEKLKAAKSPPPELVAQLCSMTDDEDARVRYQLAFALADVPREPRIAALAKLAAHDAGDSWIQSAIFSSLYEGAGEMLLQLTKNDALKGSSAGRTMLTKVAAQIALANLPADLEAAENSLENLEASQPAVAAAIVRGLAVNGSRSRAGARKLSPKVSESLQRILNTSAKIAGDTAAPLEERIEAVRNLSLGTFGDAEPILKGLLDVATPQPLQSASIETFGRFDNEVVAEILLEAWPSMTPRIRTAAADVLFSRPASTIAVLQALDAGTLPIADIDPGRIKLLEQHRNRDVRKLAERLAAKLQLGKRPEVVAEYAKAIKSLTGDVARGKTVFEKNCAACHQIDGLGHAIGPNLVTYAEKGGDAILLNVLDPNKEVNPQYIVFQITTLDGISHTGIIVGDSNNSVTLLRGENVTETILSADIDVELGGIRNTGQSLMPEGLEKSIDHQAMADLIAFLLSKQKASP